MSGNRLFITGFAEETTEADLSIFFQSRKRSGGGDVGFTKIERDYAIIEFEEDEGIKDRYLLKV